MNAPLDGNGLSACMHSFILRKKIIYVSQEQVMDCRKNVLLNRKLGNGQETKGTIMEIFQAELGYWLMRILQGNSDKGGLDVY